MQIILLTLGFWLLLPFFALLIWLRFIAYPRQARYNLILSAISSLSAVSCCAVATHYSWVGTSHRIWPLVQGAVATLFVFLTVFGIGWLLGRKLR